ncbi:hypothetical protein [Eoetvoesiella caeni]
MIKRIAVAALSAALLSLPAATMAQTPKDAPVFMNYTQAQLDHNYTQGEWAPNIKQILQRYDMRSEVPRHAGNTGPRQPGN